MAGNQTASVTDEITNSLGREILRGLFPPGSTLIGEEEICARFGASRSAAREAVKILWAKGLLVTRPSRNNPDEIAAIREAFEAMRAASSGQGDPVLSDAAFHEAVLAATGNRFFLPLSALIHTALQYSVPTTNALFGHPVGDLDAHGKVLKAIESGNSARARQAMHDMLSEVLARVRTAVELTGAG
ncbi:MAG: FadR family transcriptional regulator [Mesorhizobium sp.]|nr:MAG: FadR family transcriptional regulator [Mesorhizobium sp.]